jgi:lysophospholipase L1-like esterase
VHLTPAAHRVLAESLARVIEPLRQHQGVIEPLRKREHG